MRGSLQTEYRAHLIRIWTSSVMKMTMISLRIHSNEASTRLSWQATTRKLSSKLLKREDCSLTRNKMSRHSIFFRAVLKMMRRCWSTRTKTSSLQPTSRLSIPKQRSPKIDKSTVSIIQFWRHFFLLLTRVWIQIYGTASNNNYGVPQQMKSPKH